MMNREFPLGILKEENKMRNNEYNKRYWNDKEVRAEEAQKHTKEMTERFGGIIRDCIGKTKEYSEKTVMESAPGSTPNTCVVDEDSVTAVYEHRHGKTCVLNFASYKNPGGMFLKGSHAQEECLCHESVLYNILAHFEGYYNWNKEHLNGALYTDRALYSQDVLFVRNDKQINCDVLTCAAPNYSAFTKYSTNTNTWLKNRNTQALKKRIEFVKRIAEHNHVETLILGAFGCGVFGQNPEEVANLFKETFKTTSVKNIVYAIPTGVDRSNYETFLKIISA